MAKRGPSGRRYLGRWSRRRGALSTKESWPSVKAPETVWRRVATEGTRAQIVLVRTPLNRRLRIVGRGQEMAHRDPPPHATASLELRRQRGFGKLQHESAVAPPECSGARTSETRLETMVRAWPASMAQPCLPPALGQMDLDPLGDRCQDGRRRGDNASSTSHPRGGNMSAAASKRSSSESCEAGIGCSAGAR